MLKSHNKKAIVILLTAVLCCALLLTACGKGAISKKVDKLQIVSGSFKEVYNLDEEINYENIYIIVTYEDGKSEQIKVDKSRIEGLDLTTTGNNRKLTVTYAEASASFIYSVVYKSTVTTPVRLSAAKAEENGKKSVTLSLSALDKMPVYAVKIDIVLNGMIFVSKEDVFPSTWAAAVSESSGKLSLLFYSKDGSAALGVGEGLAKLVFSGNAERIRIDTTVSDGIEDRRAPEVILDIK